eukprot:TRINITY_DN1065_c0_g1_i2.p1 TRINITY_DN1065_c0_g1~~TRINITY_DN1065_c0_g1_i2.p1  ORF type:complete len:234 (-),score=38.95 TRINITY_DN1065_c0_g1_i2:69-770(-)
MNIGEVPAPAPYYKNVSAVSSEVKSHLIRMYTSLFMCMICASIGVGLFMQTHLHPIISFIISVVCLIALISRPEIRDDTEHKDWSLRIGLLAAIGLTQGLVIGGLVELALAVDPTIVLTALLGTVSIFGCLSAAALLAKRRKYLFLGGILSSAFSNLLLLGFVNIFLNVEIITVVYLYGGLLAFCAAVVYDTQDIIEKVNEGSRDFIRHSVDLFIDLVGMFVRILVILLRRRE